MTQVGARRLDTARQWWLRAGAFALPLAFSFYTYDQYVLPKLLTARVLVFGLAILLVARSIAAGSLTIKRTPLDLPILAFLGSAALSTLAAENVNVAVFGTYSRYDGLATLITYAALFWLTVQSVEGPAEARALLRWLLAGGYAVALIAIVQSVSDTMRQLTEVPAYGTLGQQNVLGAFLAMLAPVALWEVVESQSRVGRILAVNALAMVTLALVLTLSRSAWLGTALAAAVLLGFARRAVARLGLAGLGLAVAGLAAMAGVGAANLGLEHTVVARALTVFDPAVWNPRPQIWRDTLHLIASRPALGYGPDNFGLVYPRFQEDYLGTVQVDKAHSEVLQVTATQGLLGLAAYLFILVAFVRAFWTGRHNPGAAYAFAGWVAYTSVLQLNFSTVPASLQYWIFAACLMQLFGATRTIPPRQVTGKWPPALGAALVAVFGAGAVLTVVPPYLADAHEALAVAADYSGRTSAASAEADQARSMMPFESVYAVELGNLAFERGDWSAARAAYSDAAALGTYNPTVYRNLALADRNLGLLSEGKAAALKAVELDRFDPANVAVLAEFEALSP